MLPFPAVSQKKRIAIIPGDGIGREVIPEAVKVIAATKAPVDLTQFDWSAERYLADRITIPPDGFAMLARDFDAILVFMPRKSCSACASKWIFTPTFVLCACWIPPFVL